MDIDTIFARFLILCGLDGEEAEKYRFLCCDAAAYLSSVAVSDDIMYENFDAFCSAAAAVAAYNYSLISGGADISSFKAGDVTLSFGDGRGSAYAKEYLNKCIDGIKPFLKDSDFIFEAV